MEGIIIPESVEFVGRYAFRTCYTTILICNLDILIEEDAFIYCTMYTPVSYITTNPKDNPIHLLENDEPYSLVTDCEIVDNYVYSLHLFMFDLYVEPNGIIGCISFAANNYSPITIPYREGYKFVGLSYEKDSNSIDIYPITEVIPIKIEEDVELLERSGEKEMIYLNFEDFLVKDLDIVLYTVWEKVE